MTFDPIALAHDLESRGAFDQEVLARLDASVGFDAAFFGVVAEEATTVNLDPKKVEAVGARFGHELLPLKQAASAARGVVVDTDVLGDREVRARRYHRELAAPIGGRHAMLAMLAPRGTPLGMLMLGRCGSTFTFAQRALVEQLAPQIAIARASYHLPRMVGIPAAEPGFAARLGELWHGERVLERVRRDDVELVVRDRRGHREMVAIDASGELVWSRAALDEPERSGWFYIDLMHLAATRASRRQRFLFIGSGGGVIVRQFARVYPGARLDVVESNVEVVRLARRWFGLDAITNLDITVDDGARFLRQAESETWDGVIVDAYDGSRLAGALSSAAFFADVRRTLRPGGSVAFNVIGTLAGATDVQHVERTARKHLDVRLVPVLDPGETYSAEALRNVVVLGRRA